MARGILLNRLSLALNTSTL